MTVFQIVVNILLAVALWALVMWGFSYTEIPNVVAFVVGVVVVIAVFVQNLASHLGIR